MKYRAERVRPAREKASQFIPVQSARSFICLHHPTIYDPERFYFNEDDTTPCPDLHFSANPWAILIESSAFWGQAGRVYNSRTNTAIASGQELLGLYNRQPQRRVKGPPLSIRHFMAIVQSASRAPSASTSGMLPRCQYRA